MLELLCGILFGFIVGFVIGVKMTGNLYRERTHG